MIEEYATQLDVTNKIDYLTDRSTAFKQPKTSFLRLCASTGGSVNSTNDDTEKDISTNKQMQLTW